jgi:CRP-like cAMP-binding protein
MSMWLYELFAPEQLLRHVSLFLLVLAIGMPTIAPLRWFALASAAVAIVLAVWTRDNVGLFWQVLLALVNLMQMWVGRSRKFGRALTAEEQRFHDTIVPTLSPGQVRRLLTAGRWMESEGGRRLTEQGRPTPSLYFLSRGAVDVVVDGERVAKVGPDSLLGEGGISTGEPATATVVTAGRVRYLEFEGVRLRRLLDTHLDLLDAIELAIQKSLRDKLNRLNVATAHHEQG